MYLFTFIFLLITILGLFTHVYALQSARILGDQKIAGEQMMTWHIGAINVARADSLLGVTGTTQGCRLTPSTTKYTGLTMTAACSTVIASTNLPTNYDMTALPWESIVFQENNRRFVLTFVPPGANAASPMQPTGVTNSDLLKQLMKVNNTSPSIGNVTGACPASIMVPIVQPTTAFIMSYTVPRFGAVCYVPNGSVAIYTQLD